VLEKVFIKWYVVKRREDFYLMDGHLSLIRITAILEV